MHPWETLVREKLGLTTNAEHAAYLLQTGEFLDGVTRVAGHVSKVDAVAEALGESEYHRHTVEGIVSTGVPMWMAQKRHVLYRGFAHVTGAIRVHIFRHNGLLDLSCEILQPPSQQQIRAILDLPGLSTIRLNLVSAKTQKVVRHLHFYGRPAIENLLESLPMYIEAAKGSSKPASRCSCSSR